MNMIDPEHRRNAVTQSVKEFIEYDSDSKNGRNWPMKMAQNWSPFFLVELWPMSLNVFLFIILLTSIIGNNRVPFARVTVVNETSLRASKRNQPEIRFEVEAKLNL